MDKQTAPSEVWHKQHEYVRNYDADGQASLFAEDIIWELPFAPEGVPHKLVGKTQAVAISKAGMERSKQSGRRITDYKDVIIHETTDPEVIIAEFTLLGTAGDGTPYSIPYIQVVRVQEGKIVHLKDYFPGEVIASALKNEESS